MALKVKRAPDITPEHKERFKDESLCTNCGGCCYLAFELKKQTVIVKDLPCRHLRFNEKNESYCAIYERRLETDFCNKVSARSVRWGLFPHECPYVEGIQGYKGKVYLEDHPELYEELMEEFAGDERPHFIRAKDWNTFFNPPQSRRPKAAGQRRPTKD